MDNIDIKVHSLLSDTHQWNYSQTVIRFIPSEYLINIYPTNLQVFQIHRVDGAQLTEAAAHGF
jgi:hypothetical protein